MRLGIAIQETWDFFNDVYSDLTAHYHTRLFKRRVFGAPIFNIRINRAIYQHDMQAFLDTNDICFFEWASELLATASHLKKTCGIITRLHRYEMFEWSDKINWAAVDRVILVSKAMQQEFKVRFPDHANKSVVIPVSVSLEKFKPVLKGFKGDIGILCHLTPRKRVYDLILTFYELTQQYPNLHLHVAGGKQSAFEDYYQALQYIVKELNLEDKVTFYNHLTDPCYWYQNIDIFISNSYSEGLQVAPMQAMASGCYCLSHHWNGANELLPQENLYFTNSELKAKIIYYCMISESEKQAQRNYMRSLACLKFDIEQTKKDIRAVIDDLGANRKQ